MCIRDRSQGVPWFQSHGQWGARGNENIAPGDAIFFDWDLDGSADHVGIVVGTDGSRVYTCLLYTSTTQKSVDCITTTDLQTTCLYSITSTM